MNPVIQRIQSGRGWPARSLKVGLALLALAVACVSQLGAAPFDKQFEYTQPDGTRIQLHGKGDEFSAVFETLDGYTVVFDQERKAYCFAERAASGQLASTGVQVHLGSAAALGLTPKLRMSAEARKAMVVARYQQWEAGMQTRERWNALKQNARAYHQGLADGVQASPPPFTTVGNKVGLTILVDFSDDPATVPQADIVSYLNGDNYTGYGNNGSVKKYFQDVSNGRLTYTNVVTIYITAPQPKTIYNNVTVDMGTCGNNLLKDVLDTMKALPDYATTILPAFDALTVDANNYVVACNVFFAGANSGVWSAGLWPHSYALVQVGAQELSTGGKQVFRYQITDIGTRLVIGTFCHENGHMLCGYPDLYDYEYDSIGGAGNFCLMGSGGFDLNPAQICAYLKRASGWATTVDLTVNSTLNGVLTSSAGTNFNHFYRFEKPTESTEYYLLENRQRSGRDAGISGSGVAVWHIDELGDRDNQSVAYNTSHANYECTLVQADNRWDLQRNANAGDAADLYYENNSTSGYQNEFSDASAPSARWWDGGNSGVFFSEFSPSSSRMTFRIGQGLPLKVSSTYFLDANANHLIDFNECSDLYVVLTNTSLSGVTNIASTLYTTTPGVIIAQRNSAYPNMPGATLATNLTAFKISTAPTFNCGAAIDFQLVIKSATATATNSFVIQTGTPGSPVRFDSVGAVPIPDNGETNSTIVVSNLNFAITKVVVGVYISHSYDSDLTLQLISPDGTRCTLSRFRGANGDNYGLSCSPDSRRTLFDDAAPVTIANGVAPFLGLYRPEQPLSIFNGKSGTNLNGGWRLRVIDSARPDTGFIQCWSLYMTPTICTDGLGECPGSDLAVGITAAPEPVMVGGSLIYTLSVTNHGPSSAKNVTVSQLLPPSVLYQSSTSSQGAVSVGGNVVTCNLGQLAAGGRATVNVSVLPTTAGLITSSVTVASEQSDFDLANNTAVFVSSVNPPTSDLVIGLVASPNSTVLGRAVIYSISVTNNGPSIAAGVTVTNTFFPSVAVTASGVSQGSSFLGSNTVICTFGAMASGARATADITVLPLAEGTISVTSQVSANQYDPAIGNNVASTITVVGPSADLAVGVVASQNPIVTRSNLTFSITVTNRGPSHGSGVTLSAVLPPSFTLISATNSQGGVTLQTNAVLASIGNLPNGGSAQVWVTVQPVANGTNSFIASVAGLQPDPNSANSSVSLSIVVAPPFVDVVSAGASLTVESFVPANGAVDNGETVTALLRLRNGGNVAATNITATLLSTNGITASAVGNPQTYAILTPGGFSEGRPFTFTAAGTTSVVAVLRVQQGSTFITNLSFTFSLGTVRSYANAQSITINDNASAAPYPSTINVSGLTGVVGKVTATLVGVTHTYPQDIEVLLVGPANQKIVLMSGAGSEGLTGANLTFDDTVAAPLPPAGSPIVSGTWRPGNYLPATDLPSPAPATPYGSELGILNNANPNGAWKLFVNDRSAGDSGEIAGGWSLAFTLLVPVNQVADLAINGTASAASSLAGDNLNYVFTITNGGPNAATEVAFTNTLPVNSTLVSNYTSQGTVAVNGRTLIGNLGSLSLGTSARVSVILTPSAATAGLFTNIATVGSLENDLNVVNNRAAVVSTITLPSADLTVSQVVTPNPVVLASNLTFTVSVTNNGPQIALDTLVTNVLPSGLTFSSATASPNTSVTNLGGVVQWTIGTLPIGGVATATISATATAVGIVTNTLVAQTASLDSVTANNSAAVEIALVNPSPAVVAAGALLLAESGPVNGTVDPGETVTVALALKNVGSASTTSELNAELLPGSGVTTPGVAQNYGQLALNGMPVSRPFSFTADTSAGAEIVATLALKDGATAAGSVSYNFVLPSKNTFSNPNSVIVPDHGNASIYPLVTTVSGLSGLVDRVRVTLNGVSHSFPHDLNVLLVGPQGNSVLLMSHAGGGYAITNLNLTFDDAAAQKLPKTTSLVSGTNQPTRYDAEVSFLFPAPAAPFGLGLNSLSGTDPNGQWSLFVMDDSNGDGGNITGGYSLEITTVTTVNPVADLGVSLVSTPDNVFVGSPVTNYITINNTGPSEALEVFVTNQLAAGVNLLSATSSQGTVSGTNEGLVIAQLGTLASGASANIEIVTSPFLGGSVVNKTFVSASSLDLNPGNNSAQTTVSVFGVIPATLSGVVEGDKFNINVTAQPGLTYEIQVSSTLTNWTSISTNVAPVSGVIKLSEPFITGPATKFYRSVRVNP
jgi:M6 family metalloprotease-like protein/uncharacterized repeat protein (TIGR01451 family)